MTTNAPDLIGAPRIRVRHKADGRVRGIEVLGGQYPSVLRNHKVLGTALVFPDQRDGTVHVISVEFVRDVVVEQADRYGDWHLVGLWDWKTETVEPAINGGGR